MEASNTQSNNEEVQTLNVTYGNSERQDESNNDGCSNVEKAQKKRKHGEAAPPSTNPTPTNPIVGEPGKSKPCRPRSWAWDHFSKDESCTTQKRAKCNWCKKSYAADTHKNGTSSIINHLVNLCKKFPRESLPSQQILSFQQMKKEDGKGTGSVLSSVHFDVEACRAALARMIIVDELPFKFVEGEGFRHFMSIVQPKLPIPGRITAARDCWSIYTNEKHKLKYVFKNSNQSVSLTTDCWTSVQNMSYLCLTAHFIDENWMLHKRILNFCQVKNHKGETIGRKIEKCLESWIIGRVFTITVDNASSNDVAISYLKNRMEDWNTHPLKGEHMHVRCCAHILNLVVNDGLKEYHPSISRIRNAVRYVRASPGRMERFKICISEARILDKSTVQLDVPTRWNSTYIMLESALKFQKAFKRLGEKCAEYVMLQGGIPTNEDWDYAKCFVRFLKKFFDITEKVSGTKYVTSSEYFNEHCKILTTFQAWIDSSDRLLGSMAERMRTKYFKYWGNSKNMNMLIFIAIIFDPRHKFLFVEYGLRQIYEKSEADILRGKISDALYKLFDVYKLSVSQGQQPENSATHSLEKRPPEIDEAENSFAAGFEKTVENNENLNKNEVDLYLMESLEKKGNSTFDILTWWKVNSSKYPILSLIAKDVLAMPVSTVASESAFSTGGRVLSCYRSSLTPKTVEALVCTQNWCRSSPLIMEDEEFEDEFNNLEQEMEPIPQLTEDNSDVESD